MIPPSTAWQPPATGSPRSGSPTEESAAATAFADLLAAMLAARLPMAEFLHRSPATDLDAKLAKAGSAEIFNEHGLIEGPVAAAPAAAGQAPAGAAASARIAARGAAGPAIHTMALAAPPPGTLPGLAAASPPSDKPAHVAAPSRPVDAPHAPGTAAASGGPAATHGPSLPAAIAAPAGEPAAPEAQAPADEPELTGAPERLAEAAEEFLRGGSALDAQLSLQAGEEGLRLLARVGRLGREDRERLRTEIAQLLARHGYAAAEIRLNGDAGVPRRASGEGV